MCRLLGVVASKPRDFSLCLRDAPRSLCFLSREHSDGWGIAVHDERRAWTIHKHTAGAQGDPAFKEVATDVRGQVLVAHIRKRTVGTIAIENTHPFRSGRWVFAHNGTVEDLGHLRTLVALDRLSALQGQTDSEILFAFLLSRLDQRGLCDGGPKLLTDAALSCAVNDLSRRRPALGTLNFLLSDGTVLYAYRHGRPLFLLERSPSCRSGATPGLSSVLIASEPITEEPWRPIPEQALLCVWRGRAVGMGERPQSVVGRRTVNQASAPRAT